MKICDQCHNEIDDNLSIELQLRGEARLQLYDLGFKTTNFEFCSVHCATVFLNEAQSIIKKLKPPQTRQR